SRKHQDAASNGGRNPSRWEHEAMLQPAPGRSEAHQADRASAAPVHAANPRFRWLGVDAPASRGKELPWGAYGWAIALVVLATLVARAVYGRLDEANLILIYMLAMLPVALRGDSGAAIATAVMSVAAFDFFCVPPLYTFEVSDTQYLLTFVVMGLVGGSLSMVAARLAAEISASRQRERRARALYALSHSLLAVRMPDEVLAEGARVLGGELGLQVGAWLQDTEGEPQAVGRAPMALNTSEWQVLRWCVSEGAYAGPGTGVLPGLAHMFMPVRTSRRVHGALGIVRPAEEQSRASEIRAMLETGANQIALAIEEARAREEAAAARTQVETERLRSELLSAVSHDLRTPLTGIVGAASSLATDADALPDDVRRELAQGIVEEGDRLNRLITNLLQATRLDAGALHLNRTWCSIEEVVTPPVERLATMLERRHVTVDLPELPLLHVDVALLEQVFVNLLENAAKHTPEGTPITVRARHAGDRIEIEVSDEGPGLPAGEEEHIFEKFRSTRTGGAGLGLAICRGVVQAHGGAIQAANGPRGGASFRFWLPLTAPPPTPEERDG
ncbi:MAG TPA: ATP-binding protein, partial [Oscillatoriaceae cyanobacterium]